MKLNSKIEGLSAKRLDYLPQNMLFFTGEQSALDKLKKKLTITNKSLQYQAFRLREEIKEWATTTHDYGRERLAQAKAKLKEIEPEIKTVLWVEKEGGIVAPAGFWCLAENVTDSSHLNTDIPVYNVDGQRPYQIEAVTEALKYKRATVVLATGLGKTRGIISIALSGVKADRRTCIVVPTQNLVTQFVKSTKNFHDSVTGASSDHKPKPGCDILVTTPGTAMRYIDSYHTVIIDECVPYTQAVLTEDGPIEIGKLYKQNESGKQLPKVASYNIETESIEYKKVNKIWRQPDKEELVKIKSSRLKLRTTRNHPYLTTKGWVNAEDLTTGDVLIGPKPNCEDRDDFSGNAWNEDQWQLIYGSLFGDGSMQEDKSFRYRLKMTHGEKQSNYCKWKMRILNGKCWPIEENGYSKKPAISGCSKMFHDEPGIKKTNPPERYIKNIDARGFAILYMDDGSVDHKGRQITIHCYDCGESVVKLLSSKLNSFGFNSKHHKTPYKKKDKIFDCIKLNSSDYEKFLEWVSPYMHENLSYKLPEYLRKNAGSYKWNNETLNFRTYFVEKTEIVEYKRVKGEGYGLFDMEVEDNHNFVLSAGTKRKGSKGFGVVVHNCHHSPASTWMDLLGSCSNATHVYNFTATPFRTDGADRAIHAFGGPIVYERDLIWGIANGWLESFDTFMINVPYGHTKVGNRSRRTTAYKYLVGGSVFMTVVKQNLEKAVNSGRKVIVLVNTLASAKNLRKLCKGVVDFDVADAKFKKPLIDFQKGETSVLVATSKLVGEGIDIPGADTLFLCTQNSSPVITYQVLGRILRKGDGKKPMVLDFIASAYSDFGKSAEKRKIIWDKASDEVKTVKV